jgi:hypothetical protein
MRAACLATASPPIDAAIFAWMASVTKPELFVDLVDAATASRPIRLSDICFKISILLAHEGRTLVTLSSPRPAFLACPSVIYFAQSPEVL